MTLEDRLLGVLHFQASSTPAHMHIFFQISHAVILLKARFSSVSSGFIQTRSSGIERTVLLKISSRKSRNLGIVNIFFSSRCVGILTLFYVWNTFRNCLIGHFYFVRLCKITFEIYSYIQFFKHLFFFLYMNWALNPGPCTCEANTTTEPHPNLPHCTFKHVLPKSIHFDWKNVHLGMLYFWSEVTLGAGYTDSARPWCTWGTEL